jgi:oligopeptide/dipeptide ABC transporter ATP-binding protein
MSPDTIYSSDSLSGDLIASVSDLKVYFQSKQGMVHSVDGVSFDIVDGEMMGLVGETGCGKSVTARAFMQLIQTPPGVLAGGSIHFKSQKQCKKCTSSGCDDCSNTGREIVDLLSLTERQIRELRGERIAMIFQDPGKALNPGLTIRSQVAEVFQEHRESDVFERAGIADTMSGLTSYLLKQYVRQETNFITKLLLKFPPFSLARKKVDKAINGLVSEALAETQIPNANKIMERFPHELSGGMKQRVMIAQAIACNPDLLIADEPTTALDVTVQARVLDLIKDLQKRHKTSVLYISHDLSLVRRVCDRVAVMYAGKIVETGDAETIFINPKHPYTQGLIKALPSMTHERGKLEAIEGMVPELIEPKAGCRFASRCKQKKANCDKTDPELKAVSNKDKSHKVSCFLYE